MAVEDQAEQVVALPLVPVRSRPYGDYGGEMEAQYRRNIDRSSYARRWLSYMASRTGKMTWFDGQLPNRHTNALLNLLGFDRDDLVFVAVASKGSSKLLVSEDSDYDEPVNKYLKDELGVTVYRIEGALTRVDQ